MTELDEYEEEMFVDEALFVHACYLPPRKTTFIFKPGAKLGEGFSYNTFFLKPRLKSVPCNLKLVKKVEVKKMFVRENSIFSDQVPESKALYKKCFEYDVKYMKLNRAVKDAKEVRGVFLI